MRGKINWDGETTALLVKLAGQTKTASQIAAELRKKSPDMTRNAVIGKLKRLDVSLTGRRKRKTQQGRVAFELPALPAPTRDRVVRRSAVVSVRDSVKTEDFDFAPVGISLLIAGHDDCRWPLEGRAPDGCPRCCGAPRVVGRAYCQTHAARAYSKAQKMEEQA